MGMTFGKNSCKWCYNVTFVSSRDLVPYVRSLKQLLHKVSLSQGKYAGSRVWYGLCLAALRTDQALLTFCVIEVEISYVWQWPASEVIAGSIVHGSLSFSSSRSVPTLLF